MNVEGGVRTLGLEVQLSAAVLMILKIDDKTINRFHIYN
jgi:hypothetical protein